MNSCPHQTHEDLMTCLVMSVLNRSNEKKEANIWKLFQHWRATGKTEENTVASFKCVKEEAASAASRKI